MHNTLFVGKVCYHFDELPSTNDRALDLIAKSRPPEGTVVSADNQTAGRGQFGSRWVSAPGLNLMASFIFYPVWLKANLQFALAQAAALAVRDTVAEIAQIGGMPGRPNMVVTIKWPNDIILNQKKIAGILIQNSISGTNLNSSVIGVGLNVNQLEFPPQLTAASSLALETQQKFSLANILNRLCSKMEQRYLALRAHPDTRPQRDYLLHLHKFHKKTLFERTATGQTFEGEIQGVTREGRLIIGTETFDLKEIKMVDY